MRRRCRKKEPSIQNKMNGRLNLNRLKCIMFGQSLYNLPTFIIVL